MKCPQCGVDVKIGAKFCEECGAKIPQLKECPDCHAQLKPDAKFCSECGHNFMSASRSGALIGDKNVIAGDVTNNVTNNTYINQDETKKVVTCVVCKRAITITEARHCKHCGEYICQDHYVENSGLCSQCDVKAKSEREQAFVREIKAAMSVGRLDESACMRLEELRKELDIQAVRAKELMLDAKVNFASGNRNREPAELSNVERAQLNQASDLCFGSGNGKAAVKILEPIFKVHQYNDELLITYLFSLKMLDGDRVRRVISTLHVDTLAANVVLFEIGLMNGELSVAEKKLKEAESIWTDSIFVKCLKIELLHAMYEQFGGEDYLEQERELLPALSEECSNKVERSWQEYAKCLASQDLGEPRADITEGYCKKSDLYFSLSSGKLLKFPIANVADICDRCLKERDFEAGKFASVSDNELSALIGSAKSGNTIAQLIVGDCCLQQATESSLQDAFSWYLSAAKAGFTLALFMVGACYESGIGCDTDTDAALRWYMKAAKQGDQAAKLKAALLMPEDEFSDEDEDEPSDEENDEDEDDESSDEDGEEEEGEDEEETWLEEEKADEEESNEDDDAEENDEGSDEEEDDGVHRYKVVMTGTFVRIGRSSYKSLDGLRKDGPDFWHAEDGVCVGGFLKDDVDVRIYDENDEEVYVCNADSWEVKCKHTGDLFDLYEMDFDEDCQARLYIKELFTARCSDIWEINGEFDEAKLSCGIRYFHQGLDSELELVCLDMEDEDGFVYDRDDFIENCCPREKYKSLHERYSWVETENGREEFDVSDYPEE